MCKAGYTMRTIARARAIAIGPRTVVINGEKKAAYALFSSELKEIYETNAFNTDNLAWRKHIQRWGMIYGDVVPKDEVLLDKTSRGWLVAFTTLNIADAIKLNQYATEEKIAAVYREEAVIA